MNDRCHTENITPTRRVDESYIYFLSIQLRKNIQESQDDRQEAMENKRRRLRNHPIYKYKSTSFWFVNIGLLAIYTKIT